jgi:hypothetical protein
MNLRDLIDLRNLNIWLAVSALGCGVIAMVVVAIGVPALVGGREVIVGIGQFLLLLLTFGAMFLVAMLTGRIARENAVTYGLICSAGAVIVIIAAMPFGIVTLLLVLIAIAGGLNGGMVMERQNRRPRR